MRKADEDWLAAKWLLSEDSPVHTPALFHLQQAAEKWLKALLIHKNRDFDRRHDLHYLLELLQEKSLNIHADLMDELSPFAVEIRYPGDLPHFSRSQAICLLEKVTTLRSHIRNLI